MFTENRTLQNTICGGPSEPVDCESETLIFNIICTTHEVELEAIFVSA